MAHPKRRLIISFIGNADLEALGLKQEPYKVEHSGRDQSPIQRLLSGLPADCQAVRLILLDDDSPHSDLRKRFCDKLREQLPELGIDGIEVKRHPVSLPDGPTDLSALYEEVWKAIPTSGPDSADEVVFHLTSGTPAMQLTLMLASQSLRLHESRLFETSREQGVRELKPPYALALRRKRERERVAYQSPGSLSEEARKGLLKGTVVEDRFAESAYAALHKSAGIRKQTPRVLISGPTGSGKWRACKQFARWRKCQNPVIWTDPANCPELPEGAGTLLVRWLDAWPESALRSLAQLADERQELAIAATVRTDRLPSAGLETLWGDGLRGAVCIDLPALGARTDVIALADSLADQLRIAKGKIKERLQLDFFEDRYPHGLHDLKSRLATANAYSPGKHLKREAYLQARDRGEAQRLLDKAWQVLAGMDFGPKRRRLDDVLKDIRLAVVKRARAEGRSRREIGDLLGFSPETARVILKPKSKPQLGQGVDE